MEDNESYMGFYTESSVCHSERSEESTRSDFLLSAKGFQT